MHPGTEKKKVLRADRTRAICQTEPIHHESINGRGILTIEPNRPLYWKISRLFSFSQHDPWTYIRVQVHTHYTVRISPSPRWPYRRNINHVLGHMIHSASIERRIKTSVFIIYSFISPSWHLSIFPFRASVSAAHAFIDPIGSSRSVIHDSQLTKRGVHAIEPCTLFNGRLRERESEPSNNHNNEREKMSKWCSMKENLSSICKNIFRPYFLERRRRRRKIKIGSIWLASFIFHDSSGVVGRC